MKRAVKWTSTDVDERRPLTGWKTAVWLHMSLIKVLLPKVPQKVQILEIKKISLFQNSKIQLFCLVNVDGRKVQDGRRQPVEKCRMVDVDVDGCLFLRRQQAALFIMPPKNRLAQETQL